jgi:hypothetical protein
VRVGRGPAAADAPTWAVGSVALPATRTPGTSVLSAAPETKRRPMPSGGSSIGGPSVFDRDD